MVVTVFSIVDTQVKERFMWASKWGKDLPEEVTNDLGLEEQVEFRIHKGGFKVQERGGQREN